MPRSPRPVPLEPDPPPVLGAILLGGGSRRMGKPKHLLGSDGVTWLEQIDRILGEVVPASILVGAGELPAALAARTRIADAPGVEGPVAGLLAALELRRDTAWLALACDQPLLTVEALRWILAQRDPSAVAILPRLTPERVEPFPALYEPGALAPLRELARATGPGRSLQRLTGMGRVLSPQVPPSLAGAFRGANTPGEARALDEIPSDEPPPVVRGRRPAKRTER